MQGRKTPIGKCFWLMFRRLGITLAIGILLATMVVFLIFLNAILPGRMTGVLTVLLSVGLGMYPLARWGPALVTAPLERQGFSALQRSDWLSAGYRWQGAGTIGLALMIGVIFGGAFIAGVILVGGYLLNELLDARMGNSLEEVLVFLDGALGLCITIAIVTLTVVVLRLRLIEIKEPPDLEEMIDVFE
jgi:hypothetical protein